MDFPFPVSPEDAQALETLMDTLEKLYEDILHPFPYADIRHIYKTVTSRKIKTRRTIDKGFIPDLSYYWSNIAGCSSWGKNALKWNTEKRQEFGDLLGESFFDNHPEYLLVRRWITEANTLDLYRDFVLYEEMRLNALALIRLLDKLQNQPEKP